ncbi:MAG: cysteine--tRNA ligase [Planctomycetota bacterium]|nr:cysteine--tRNA ligase [Planctomycetota bacterium]
MPAKSAPAEAIAPLRIYNTLSRTKENFEPVKAGEVGMYLCGPTVYKPSHIGHMVGPVIFDAIKRYLTYCGYKVTWVVNITDVDDKLIKESNARKMTMAALATEMTADYQENLAALNVSTIDHFPKATDNIDEILRIVSRLIEQGFAYASEGDVYFEVGKDPGYGKLSRRSLDSVQGEGGETADRKRSTSDFALWKSAKPDEPAWDSPWGKGRPGWHIECTAMSHRILGETFDIHGGGLDLIFPHHENEIAQSECCHGKPQAKYWLHNGLMQSATEVGKVGGRSSREASPATPAASDIDAQQAAKISKSTGATPFKQLLERHAAETIRFFLLSTHYRSPIQYSEELLQETARSLEGFYRYIKRYDRITGERFYQLTPPATRNAGAFDPNGNETLTEIAAIRARFQEAMDDDFNTGGGIATLFDLLRVLNKFADVEKLEAGTPDAAKLAVFKQGTLVLREISSVLGLFLQPAAAKAAGDDALVDQLMRLVIEVRANARKNKDFGTADIIRNRLTEIGIALEDRPGGTEWTKTG